MGLESELAAYLESSGAIAQEDLNRARTAAREVHSRLDQVLLELGLIAEAQLHDILRLQFRILDYVATGTPNGPVDMGLPRVFLAARSVIPITIDDQTIQLAMVDPFDDFAAQAVALKTGRSVARLRIRREVYQTLWASIFGEPEGASGRLPTAGYIDAPNTADLTTLRDSASDAPVVRFVQDALRTALAAGASDIHLKPSSRGAEMAFRIDGRLEQQSAPDPRMYSAVISRLKILANLDIAERRLPQDGKFTISIGGQATDVRISTMAHVHGEAAVLRILSRQLTRTSLSDLGFSQHIESALALLTKATEGLVLVTGPTGSGKSTTLHAVLHQLARPDLNVVTVEDPVEHKVDGIAQIQVDEKAGLTFPKILRSLLRQDPDIILVGEIRDAETASIAVQAALTGHLVLATLHTNSALAAVPRLIDMGVEPYLLASVLRGVLAQRLVRRRCASCEGATRHQSAWNGTAHFPQTARHECPSCGGSGYSSRVAVGELALLDEELVDALAHSVTLAPQLDLKLRTRGYRPMREDALARLQSGEIASDEFAAVA